MHRPVNAPPETTPPAGPPESDSRSRPPAPAAAWPAAFTPRQRIARWIGILAALAGGWLCIDLLRLGGGAGATNPLIGAVCGGGAESACSTILRSEHAFMVLARDNAGEPIARAPWSVVGLGYFAAVACWFLLIGPSARGAALRQLPLFMLLLAGLLVSVSLVQVMQQEFGDYCRACLAAHGLNALLLLAAVLMLPFGRAAARSPGRGPALSHALAGAVLLVAIALLGITVGGLNVSFAEAQTYKRLLLDPEYIGWRYSRAPLQSIPARAGGPAGAAPATQPAAHRIVMFSDFRCGACRTVHALLARLQAAYPGRFSVEVRNYPLDTCNPHFTRHERAHPHACEAARAFEAVRQVAAPAVLESFGALLFNRQNAITPPRLREWALDAGVDAAAFDAAYAAPQSQAAVAADIELARSLGVRSTPSVFLDGRLVEGARSPQTWLVLLGIEAPASAPAPAAAPAPADEAPAAADEAPPAVP